MKKKLKIPKFKNSADEREFWAKIELSDYFEEDFFDTKKVVYLPLKYKG